MTTSEKVHSGIGRWWPFSALCCFMLLRWNLADSFPQIASTATSEALGCGAAALILLVGACFARAARPHPASLLQACAAGVLLLAGPGLALLFPSASLSASALMISLGLTPVVVAVALNARSAGTGVSAALLVPGIAAISGLLLLIPTPHLDKVSADALLVLVPLLTGVGCVLFPRDAATPLSWCGALASAGATFVFGLGVAGQCVGRGEWTSPNAWTVVGDGLLALLAMHALGRLDPLQYSAQFVLVPLLALVEAWALLRSQLSLRSAIGLLLLAAGTVAQLRRPDADALDEPLSLVP